MEGEQEAGKVRTDGMLWRWNTENGGDRGRGNVKIGEGGAVVADGSEAGRKAR